MTNFTLKKFISLALSVAFLFTLCSCGAKNESENGDKKTITIAYQGGIGYAPIHIMEAEKLIQSNYGKEIEVNFEKMDSGAVINERLQAGTVDIGCMGVGPAIIAVANGIVDGKIMSNLCSQSHGLMSNDPNIKSLKDIKEDDKIALVNIGSIQHVLLAMAAEKELGDPRALDNSINPLAHADGMTALESGTVKLHLTSSPFINQERANSKFHEIPAVKEVWPDGNSFLVAMASNDFEKNNKELYNAIAKAIDDAIGFINNNQNEAAKIISKYIDQDVEKTLEYLKDETCMFFPELKGVNQMASFMDRAKFINRSVTMEELKFSNVKGE